MLLYWLQVEEAARKKLLQEARELVTQRALGADDEFADAREQAYQDQLDALHGRLGQSRLSLKKAGKFESDSVVRP